MLGICKDRMNKMIFIHIVSPSVVKIPAVESKPETEMLAGLAMCEDHVRQQGNL